MKENRFYFLKDEYYKLFSDYGAQTNKVSGGRPCYYCLQMDGFYWMIPISSKVKKYEAIHAKNSQKHRQYFGIVFGYVNGQKRAFLIQNIIPVTAKYIENIYTINHGTTEVTVNKKTEKALLKAAKQTIRMYKNGIKTTFSDISYIETVLSSDKNTET